MSITDQRLLALLEAKSFGELSNEEKAFVIEHISESEYELQHQLLSIASDVLEEEGSALTPDPRIKSNLKNALSEKGVAKSGIIRRLMFKSIPAYQMAAAFAILALLFAWQYEETSVQIVYQDKIVYQDRIDTVIIEKPVVEIQTVEKVIKEIQYVSTDKKQTVKPRSPYQSEQDRLADAAANTSSFGFTDAELEENKVKSFGNTAVDEGELSKFVVVLEH